MKDFHKEYLHYSSYRVIHDDVVSLLVILGNLGLMETTPPGVILVNNFISRHLK